MRLITTPMRMGVGVDRCGLGEGGGSFPLLPGRPQPLPGLTSTQPPPPTLSEEPGGLLSSPVGPGPYQWTPVGGGKEDHHQAAVHTLTSIF